MAEEFFSAADKLEARGSAREGREILVEMSEELMLEENERVKSEIQSIIAKIDKELQDLVGQD